MKKFFSFLFVAVVAFAAQATELTVYQGNATNAKVPLYGMYLDSPGTQVQVMYPESALSDMVGQPINSVKFYITNTNGNPLSGGSVEVLVGTTTQTAYPSYSASPITGLTHVANISMTAGETEILINFEEPFVYEGGNLVIETLVKEATADYDNINFAGVEQYGSYNALTYTYSYSTQSFYPMATFDYTPAENSAVVSPAVIDFGSLYPEQTATQTFIIKNSGLNAFTPVFSGIEAPFSVAPAPAEIVAGETVEYTVTFAPAALGEYAATLAIDCGAAGQFQVALSGAQVEVPAEVVVAEGTATSNTVPIETGDYDYSAGNNQAQMIYNADMLAALVGKKINGVKFHTSAPMERLNGGKIQLSMKVVDQSVFESTTAITDLTVVATGAPVLGESEIVFNFDEPFTYEGGNLVIETLVIEAGDYSFRDKFLGVTTTDYVSYAHFNSSGWESHVYKF